MKSDGRIFFIALGLASRRKLNYVHIGFASKEAEARGLVLRKPRGAFINHATVYPRDNLSSFKYGAH